MRSRWNLCKYYLYIQKIQNNKYIHFFEKIEKKDIVLKKRNIEGYKGNYGHVIVIGGSWGFTGAPVITANSAVRSGAGLVTLCIEDKIENMVIPNLLEAMSCVFSNETKINKLLKNASVIALGPGMGEKKTLDILKHILNPHLYQQK